MSDGCSTRGGSFFPLQVITYKCDGRLQKYVGRKDFFFFFRSGRKQKTWWEAGDRSKLDFYVFSLLDFHFGQCIADVSSRLRIFSI